MWFQIILYYYYLIKVVYDFILILIEGLGILIVKIFSRYSWSPNYVLFVLPE